MEKISEMENDDYEEFTVEEDTVITQAQWWVSTSDW